MALRSSLSAQLVAIFGLALAAVLGSVLPTSSLADDSTVQNAERIKQMSPDQKDDLRRKKLRFDELSPDEKQRLRDLHASITSDPNAADLSDTATRYTRWLSSLEATERSTLLDIKDPEQRIARIKDETSTVSVLTHTSGDRVDGLVVLIFDAEDMELVFAHLAGEIDVTRLGEIGDRLNVPGLDDVPGVR